MKSTESTMMITGRYLGETAKAVRFAVHQVNGEHLLTPQSEWFPFSQIERSCIDPEGTEATDYLIISEWIAKQKDLL